MKKIYYPLIQPYIIYGTKSSHGASQSATSGFLILQKKTVRPVLSLDYNAHTNEYYKKKVILKCNETYKLNSFCYLYKIIRSGSNNYFVQYLRTQPELYSHNTRNNSYLIIPRFNLSTSQNLFVFQSIKSWESPPPSKLNSSKFSKI